jgi:hypothetical protein
MRKSGVSNTVTTILAVVLLLIGLAGGYLISSTVSMSPTVVTKTAFVTVGGTVTERITITTAVAQPTGPPLKIGMTISKDGLFAPLTSGYEAFNRE